MIFLFKEKVWGGLALLLVVLLVFSAIGKVNPAARNHQQVPGIKVYSASYRADDLSPDTRPLSPTIITVDTARKRSTDTDILRETLAGNDATLPRSETLGIGKAFAEIETDWFEWARLGSAQADSAITQTTALPSNSVRAYSAHSAEGSAIVVANTSARQVPVRVRIRLPRGVYKIERLSFVPTLEEPVTTSLRTGEDGPAKFRGDTITRLERLQGRELARTGTIEKPVMVEPGAVCILRFTEQVREVAQTYREANASLNRLAKTNASAARRIRLMLQEGGLQAASLYASSNSVGKRLSRIHRMLLVTAQAQSRQKNDLARKAVPAQSGTNLMNALDRLTDSLSETSALLLGLVPRITFERLPVTETATARLQESEDRTSATPSPFGMIEVTVVLTNAGSQSVKLVKLGMDTTKLPQGVACDPTEPALFGTLQPGQTARATFRLRGQAGLQFPAHCCVGDVSYFVPDAPAHLRPRSL